MSQGDTSRRVGVAFEGDACDTFEGKGDACDTFDPRDFEREDAAARGRDGAAKQGDSRVARRDKKRSVTRRTEAVRPLLVSSLSEHTPPLEAEEPATDVEPLDRALRWLMLACINPALEVARPAALRLVSVGLMGAHLDSVDEAARDFAPAILDHPLGGALLSRDRGAEHGRPHYHGLVLARSTDRIHDCWGEFAGESEREPEINPVRYWRYFCREPYERRFGEHLLRVVQYMVKPWPARYGRRSLDRDVVASGAFVGPLQAVRTLVAGGVALPLESLVKASPTCRLCRWCEKPLPVDCRSDKLRHDLCRRTDSKAKLRAKRAAERANPGKLHDRAG